MTSNHGPQTDVVAPGGDLSSEIPTLGVDGGADSPRWIVRRDHGTSIAAAYVSGVLALLAGLDDSLTLRAARDLLAASTHGLGSLGSHDRDDRSKAGLLDAFTMIGTYQARGSVLPDRTPRRRATRVRAAAHGTAAPEGNDHNSLIVRFRDGVAAHERPPLRLAGAIAEGGSGGYALVRLSEGQDRVRVEAQLLADPAVAAVYDNRIYQTSAVLSRGSVAMQAGPRAGRECARMGAR